MLYRKCILFFPPVPLIFLQLVAPHETLKPKCGLGKTVRQELEDTLARWSGARLGTLFASSRLSIVFMMLGKGAEPG
jgi:hypothetical protein